MTVYLMAGGGTAGHVNPLLATADRLREREPDAEVLVLGTAEGLEARLVPARGYELVTIPRLPFPRRPNADAVRFPGRWKASVVVSWRGRKVSRTGAPRCSPTPSTLASRATVRRFIAAPAGRPRRATAAARARG